MRLEGSVTGSRVESVGIILSMEYLNRYFGGGLNAAVSLMIYRHIKRRKKVFLIFRSFSSYISLSIHFNLVLDAQTPKLCPIHWSRI